MMEGKEHLELIYFPTADEAECGYPYVVYAADIGNVMIRAARSIEALEQGRYGILPKRYCLPFTDELWERCQQHIQKREALEAEYRELASLAKKKRKLL